MSAQIPSFQLNDSTRLPAVGTGCWIGVVQGGGQRVIDMCTKALKVTIHLCRHWHQYMASPVLPATTLC
ncbi:hypothetical protein BDN71DRAFT_485599 [Pleurotus eryngii]|uniref:Uncharacterized protein n=1 Tax=Pleurotus eryngii TaxID=5323 RepID=A0A9P6A9M2_PLEER|nr:hypothetical protein BDN71DRAFT_485599 [Pleurotus eryngii]